MLAETPDKCTLGKGNKLEVDTERQKQIKRKTRTNDTRNTSLKVKEGMEVTGTEIQCKETTRMTEIGSRTIWPAVRVDKQIDTIEIQRK
jgi:hypothetical protein